MTNLPTDSVITVLIFMVLPIDTQLHLYPETPRPGRLGFNYTFMLRV